MHAIYKVIQAFYNNAVHFYYIAILATCTKIPTYVYEPNSSMLFLSQIHGMDFSILYSYILTRMSSHIIQATISIIIFQ